MKNIAILASGSGTNAENIVKTFANGNRIRVALVMTNRARAGVVARMERLGVPTEYVPNRIWDEEPQAVVDILRRHDIDLVVLAGFMHYVAPAITAAYAGRIVNIHPSLLPAYGGKGMYGHHVHEAVIRAGEKKSGVTVHYVTDEMDGGEIVMQESLDVLPGDTPSSLEERIHAIEYSLYPRAIVKALENGGDSASGIVGEETKTGATSVPSGPEAPAALEKSWAEVLGVPIPDEGAVPPPVPGRKEEMSGSAAPSRPADEGRKVPSEPMPPANMLWAVLAMVLCNFIAGIVAVVFASRVSGCYYQGDIEGARRASRNAEIWIIVSIVVGVVVNSLYFPVMLLSGI